MRHWFIGRGHADPSVLGTWSLIPEDFDVMNKAFSAALQKLGLRDLKNPMTEIVAQRIINAVLAGEPSISVPG